MTTARTSNNATGGVGSLFNRLSWPLAAKLIAIILIATVIPQLVVAGVNYAMANSRATRQVGTTVLARESSNVSGSFAKFLAGHIALVETMTLDPDLQDMLRSRLAEYPTDSAAALQDLLAADERWRTNSDTELINTVLSNNPGVNPITPSLQRFSNLFEEHTTVFITDAKGAVVASTALIDDYYQGDEEWWQAAFNDGRGAVHLSDPINNAETSGRGVFIAAPVISDMGEVVGVIRSTLSVAAILGELATVTFGESGRAMLFTADGQLIADPNSADASTLAAEFVISLLENDLPYTTATDSNGEQTLFGYSRLAFPDLDTDATVFAHGVVVDAIDDLSWIVVTRQLRSEAIEPFVQANVVLSLMSFAGALLGIGIAYLLLREILAQVNAMPPVFSAVEQGDLSARIPVLTNDELGRAASSFNSMLNSTVGLIQSREERDSIQNSIFKLSNEVRTVADGDLTVEAEVSNDVTGAVASSFNLMIEQLRDIIMSVQDATLQVSSSANEIQTTAEHLAFGSETQASQIVDTSAAIDEMSVSIQQVSENARLSAEVGEEARRNARLGAESVQNTITGMDRIQDEVESTAMRIAQLGETSQRITSITRLINDIAERTSILAINASIQASEAGDAGRGFAVVAEEVERLADRSLSAAREINRLVRAIQVGTTEAVIAMESTSREVTLGNQLAHEAGDRLQEIEQVSGRLSDLIQSISLASQQQARGSETIARSMNDIADVTQQTAAGTKEATVSIGNLARLADELRSSVSMFKLRQQQAAAD